MPAQTQNTNIERREILRTLGSFTSEELIEMRQELKDQIKSGIFMDSETEVGRSSTAFLLQDPTVSLDCINTVLNKRGKLTAEERRDWLSARPKTSVRMVLSPFRGTNL